MGSQQSAEKDEKHQKSGKSSRGCCGSHQQKSPVSAEPVRDIGTIGSLTPVQDGDLVFDDEIKLEPPELVRPGRKRPFYVRQAAQASRVALYAATVSNIGVTRDTESAPVAANVLSSGCSASASQRPRANVQTDITRPTKLTFNNKCTRAALTGENTSSSAIRIPGQSGHDVRQYVKAETSGFGLPSSTARKGTYVTRTGATVELVAVATKIGTDERLICRPGDHVVPFCKTDRAPEPVASEIDKSEVQPIEKLQRTAIRPGFPEPKHWPWITRAKSSMQENVGSCVDGATVTLANQRKLVLPAPPSTSNKAGVTTCDSDRLSSPVRKGCGSSSNLVLNQKSDGNRIQSKPDGQEETAPQNVVVVTPHSVTCDSSQGADRLTNGKIQSVATTSTKTSPLAEGQRNISSDEADATFKPIAPPATVAAAPSAARTDSVTSAHLSSSEARQEIAPGIAPTLAPVFSVKPPLSSSHTRLAIPSVGAANSRPLRSVYPSVPSSPARLTMPSTDANISHRVLCVNVPEPSYGTKQGSRPCTPAASDEAPCVTPTRWFAVNPRRTSAGLPVSPLVTCSNPATSMFKAKPRLKTPIAAAPPAAQCVTRSMLMVREDRRKITPVADASACKLATSMKEDIPKTAPKPVLCSQVKDIAKPVYEKKQWYLQRLRHCDNVYAEDKAKYVFWLFARFLANEEFQIKMVENCMEEFPSEGDLSAAYNRVQRLLSYFLRVSLRHLPQPVMSFLLSNEHRLRTPLELPLGLNSIRSIEKYMKESDVYSKLMQNAICAEAKEAEKRRTTAAKVKPKALMGKRSAPAFVRFPSENEDPQEKFDWRKWWTAYSEKKDERHAIDHYIICGCIRLLRDNSGFEFIVETVDDEATVAESLKKVSNESDEINVINSNSAGIALWISTDLLVHEQHRKKAFPLIMHRINPTPFKHRQRPGTHLPTFYRQKSHRCSVEELISWPWVDKKVGNLVTEVRCLVRFNVTLKNLRTKIDARHTPKKNKGKRGKRGRAKARLGFRDKDHAWDWQANMDRFMASGDHLATDNGTCPFAACRNFFDDMEMKDICSSCKATTVFPLYERATRRLVFYSAAGSGGGDGGTRKVPSVFPYKLPEVFGKVDESIDDDGCWITDSTPLATVTTSTTGTRHHHGNLIVDILLPKFPSEQYSIENMLADVTLLLRSLTEYARDVYVHLFASDVEEMESAQKQIKETQLLCEDVFSLMVFGEICGFAELHLRGGYYITSAHQHYSKARDIATDVGILPVFFGFLREHLAKFPTCYRIARRVKKVFFALFPFLDLSPLDSTETAEAKLTSHSDVGQIQPIAIALLESVMKHGYTDGVDDDIAFRALQCSSKDLTEGGMALISPVAESGFSPHAKLRQRGFRNVRFTRRDADLQRKTENLDRIVGDVLKEFCDWENSDQYSNDESDEKVEMPFEDNGELWDVLHDIMRDVQLRDPPAFDRQRQAMLQKRKAERISFTLNAPRGVEETKQPLTPMPDDGCDGGRKGQSPEKKGEDERVDLEKHDSGGSTGAESVEKTKEATDPKAGDYNCPNVAEKQDENPQEAVKVQIKNKKSTRGHMSTEKRQQRQAQRLKEKWQKKQKEVNKEAVESNGADCE